MTRYACRYALLTNTEYIPIIPPPIPPRGCVSCVEACGIGRWPAGSGRHAPRFAGDPSVGCLGPLEGTAAILPVAPQAAGCGGWDKAQASPRRRRASHHAGRRGTARDRFFRKILRFFLHPDRTEPASRPDPAPHPPSPRRKRRAASACRSGRSVAEARRVSAAPACLRGARLTHAAKKWARLFAQGML